ncbi:MAG: transketolase [Candidatus Margulisiibacteriota bacterium]
MSIDNGALKKKADWVRRETIRLHGQAPQTRLASSLSCVEIIVSLFYGGILEHNPKEIYWEGRDRFIISKGHGSICMYPVLADKGYFDKEELKKICKSGTFLGSIPDPMVPGYETMNGSLGHGLGVAVGSSIGMKAKGSKNTMYVLSGDGELNEGSVWEAVMFAAHNRTDNLILIIDNNKACMLDFCKNIINIEPLESKFDAFGWEVKRIDGHDIGALCGAIGALKNSKNGKPKVLIADTTKGKGIPSLESDPLSHIKEISADKVEVILKEWKNEQQA